MKYARLIALVLLNLAALGVIGHGLRDMAVPSVAEHLLASAGAPASGSDEATVQLVVALLYALGAALIAVGLVALTLINGPVRRGSALVLVGTFVMIAFVEGVNACAGSTVNISLWAPLTLITMALVGGVLLMVSRRAASPMPAVE